MDNTETERETKMKCIIVNIRTVQRNWAWIVHMFFSLTVMCTMLDNISPSDMRDMELFALIASMSSLAISVVISAMHYINYFKKFVGGTLFELSMVILLHGLWVVAAVVIQDPENNIATTISSTGVENIQEANLYFFVWFALFSNVYLIGSFFRNYKTYNLRVLGWISLLAGSLILLGVSSHLKEGICNTEDEVLCFRIKYAMVSSTFTSGISLITSVLSCFSKISTRWGLLLASPVAAAYAFGVVVLTSTNGPGHTLGTIYFTIWIGSGISCLLLIGEYNELFVDRNEQDVISNAQKVVPMGNNGIVESESVLTDSGSLSYTITGTLSKVELSYQEDE